MSEQENDLIVTALSEGFNRGDVEAIMALFSDDAVYHNIPFKPVQGKAAIEATIRGFLDGSAAIVFETHHQLARGDLVMNERTDTITTDDKTVALPVMGVFELAEGKITAWRDYFDAKTFTG